MTLSDVSIIGKKIVVGIIITVVPFVIIVGSLWLTQKALGGDPKPQQQISKNNNNIKP